MSAVRIADVEGVRVALSADVYAEVVTVGSRKHDMALRLEAERFAQVQSMRDGASYVEVTDTAPNRIIPILVWRDVPPAATRSSLTSLDAAHTHAKLLGTARLELPGGMLIESMIRLKEGSPAARLLESGMVAEVGGFAPAADLDKASLFDTIDAVTGVCLRVAKELGIKWFWIFPRNGFMSLMRADIPDLLPPFRFSLCPDVEGWDETSERLKRFRAMHLRGFGKYPEIYQISADDYEADLAHRLALRQRRAEFHYALEQLLPRAMVQAQREIVKESRLAMLRSSSPFERESPAMRTASEDHALQSRRAREDQMEEHTPVTRAGFLPFAASATAEAEYLRSVIEQGGSPAREYKRLSYQMLGAREGMRVLDVGCGSGVDLAALAEIVGPRGVVIGVDREPNLIAAARNTLDQHGLTNAWVFEDNAEHLAFSAGEFDRVRADRALQHMRHPAQAIAQMWRVLRSDGVLTVIEPDWATMAIYPSAPAGENDDTAFQHVLRWCRKKLEHPLIGRQLHALLRNQGEGAWSSVGVRAVTYTFTEWTALDAVLQLSRAAQALASEDATLSQTIDDWLGAVEDASNRGDFFAAVPLFFAYASKAQDHV